MHAYLLIGHGKSNLKTQISKLSEKLNAKILDFPLVKIDDVRNLNSMIRLSLNEPTLIVSENIQNAGTEALNAFLKNLEEPQENVYFALTAPSIKKVLPTIASRCQIIRVNSQKEENRENSAAEKFAEMTKGEMFKTVEKLTDRNTAIEFVEKLIEIYHSRIHKGEDNDKYAKNAEIAIKILSNLNANGNVSLQLSNLIISLT